MNSEKPGRAKPDSGATIELRGASARRRGAACTPPLYPTRFPRTQRHPGGSKTGCSIKDAPQVTLQRTEKHACAVALCRAQSHARETFAKFWGVIVFAGPEMGIQHGGYSSDSPHMQCESTRGQWLSANFIPRAGKFAKSPPTPPNVVRLARQEVQRVRLEDLGSPEVSPVATREKYPAVLRCARPCQCAHSPLSHSPHLRRRSGLYSGLECLLLVRALGLGDRGGSRVRGRGPE